MASALPTTISRYKILQRLGEGGMGSLYLARDPAIDRLLAIKLLREDVESDELRERFAREARAVGRLRHQNIVVVFDVGEDDNRPFIAMEYIEGETLGSVIRERRNVTIDRKLQWLEQLCDGLAYAHRAGLVHRDVKPANLMVDTDQVLKILDFGIARIGHAAATGMTQAGTLMGTLNYMSPEQMTGRPVDHRSDIFAVGAVAYELLTYQRAFPGDIQDGVLHRIIHEPPAPIEKFVPGIDRGLVKVVDNALIKDRDQRYQDLDDMRADLAEVRQRLKHGPPPLVTPAGPRGLTKDKDLPTPRSTPPITDRGRPRGTDPAAAAKARAQKIERLLENARNALQEGSVDDVFQGCQQVLELDPDNIDAVELSEQAQAIVDDQQLHELLDGARGHLARGELDQAGQLVEQALALNPGSNTALRVRKEVSEAQRQLELQQERELEIRQAVERAVLLIAQRSYETAVQFADKALALDPRDRRALDVKQRALDAIEMRRRQQEEEKARVAAEAERKRKEAAVEAERQRVAAIEAERRRREVEESERNRRQAAADAERQRQAAAEAERRRRDAQELERQRRETQESERRSREDGERRSREEAERRSREPVEKAARSRRLPPDATTHQPPPQAEERRPNTGRLTPVRDTYSDATIVSPSPYATPAAPPPVADPTVYVPVPPVTDRPATQVPSTGRLRSPAAADATRYMPEPAADLPIRPQPRPQAPPRVPPPVPVPAPGLTKPSPNVMIIGGVGVVVGIAIVVAIMMRGPGSTDDKDQPPPPPVGNGSATLSVTPWANVESLASKSGTEYRDQCPATPCLVRLPAGEYNVRLSAPGYKTIDLPFTIAPGASQVIRQQMDGFDPNKAVTDVLGR